MSFSVDDLVASFGTSHIGQEQLDLQAFKAQMAQQLNLQGDRRPTQGMPMPIRRNSLAQPHANSPAQQTTMASEDDREDEMMVEDMLVAPASPTTTAAPSAPWTQQQQPSQATWAPTPQPPYGISQQCAQEPASLFTTTDPFYLALTQHAQQSYFSRANHPSAFQRDAGPVLVDR
ncbi:unnamed protein product [Peniophora sp. CBMAI 1063]|nr:unnamed protein product [Peniophora sp. CBMAI 1063]